MKKVHLMTKKSVHKQSKFLFATISEASDIHYSQKFGWLLPVLLQILSASKICTGV